MKEQNRKLLEVMMNSKPDPDYKEKRISHWVDHYLTEVKQRGITSIDIETFDWHNIDHRYFFELVRWTISKHKSLDKNIITEELSKHGLSFDFAIWNKIVMNSNAQSLTACTRVKHTHRKHYVIE
ncbi:hypothetical protein L4D00_15040 [Photobacterium swingsii]|uniref:hypothetical protein n=1 Tax=Photobacterium swingsii TaxID=680026 RepID=UPI003D108624